MAKEWPAVRKKLVNFDFMGYKMKKTLVHPLGAVSVGLNGPLAVPQLGDFQSLPVRRAVYSQNYLVKGRHQLYWLDYSGVWTARAASHQQADASDTSGANTAALVFPVDCPNKPAVLSCVASCGFIFALYSPALYVLRESKDNSSGLVNLEFVTQCDLSTAMSSVDVPLAMVLQDAALSADAGALYCAVHYPLDHQASTDTQGDVDMDSNNQSSALVPTIAQPTRVAAAAKRAFHYVHVFKASLNPNEPNIQTIFRLQSAGQSLEDKTAPYAVHLEPHDNQVYTVVVSPLLLTVDAPDPQTPPSTMTTTAGLGSSAFDDNKTSAVYDDDAFAGGQDTTLALYSSTGSLLSSQTTRQSLLCCSRSVGSTGQRQLFVGLSVDVNLLVYAVNVQIAAQTDQCTVDLKHVSCFPALSYVQQSKQHKKFFALADAGSFSFAAIAEYSGYVYVYERAKDKQPQSGQGVVQLASKTNILGLQCVGDVLYVLTDSALFAYRITCT